MIGLNNRRSTSVAAHGFFASFMVPTNSSELWVMIFVTTYLQPPVMNASPIAVLQAASPHTLATTPRELREKFLDFLKIDSKEHCFWFFSEHQPEVCIWKAAGPQSSFICQRTFSTLLREGCLFPIYSLEFLTLKGKPESTTGSREGMCPVNTGQSGRSCWMCNHIYFWGVFRKPLRRKSITILSGLSADGQVIYTLVCLGISSANIVWPLEEKSQALLLKNSFDCCKTLAAASKNDKELEPNITAIKTPSLKTEKG